MRRQILVLFLPVFVLAAIIFSCSTPSKVNRVPQGKMDSVFPDDQAKCIDANGNPNYDKPTDAVSPGQAAVIERVMHDHMMRLNHVLWHATRNGAPLGWTKKGFTAPERQAINAISPQWGLNAPVCPLPDPSIAKATKQNASGEEFLLMHHTMVDALRVALENANQKCISGWTALPSTVPPAIDSQDTSKSAQTGAMMAAWMTWFDDSKNLQGKSLSLIGTLIENSIHNNMHMRWSPPPGPGDEYSPVDGKYSTQSLLSTSTHDDAQYHWLGNPFSAHVDPTFWKLHGWVDSIIPKWLTANGYTQISAHCNGVKTCYEWKSDWTGGMVHTASSSLGGKEMVMEPPNLSPALETKIFAKASFRNRKFENFIHPKPMKDGNGKAMMSAAAPPVNVNDPVAYVNAFGPCAPGN